MNIILIIGFCLAIVFAVIGYVQNAIKYLAISVIILALLDLFVLVGKDLLK